MEEDTADIDTMWPQQDDGCLTANATSYVDDYLQAIESELYSDSALLYADAPYPDLYGATVDWEPMLQRKYAPATQKEQMGSSPYTYTAPAAVADQLCLAIAKTGSERRQIPCSSCAHLWTDEKVYSANGSLSTPTTTPYLRNGTREPHFFTPDCLPSLSELASEDFSDPAGKEEEFWISPQDLVFRGKKDSGSMQARKKHEGDVMSRYLRAEQEIASLSRGALHSRVSTTRRRRGVKTKQVRVNRQKCRKW